MIVSAQLRGDFSNVKLVLWQFFGDVLFNIVQNTVYSKNVLQHSCLRTVELERNQLVFANVENNIISEVRVHVVECF